jgi:hypothetical protein
VYTVLLLLGIGSCGMSEISLMYFYYINLLILQMDLYLQKYFEILATM